jgi:S-DNA-T family DNA segregation ATPase FtsK/SpoIIIE
VSARRQEKAGRKKKRRSKGSGAGALLTPDQRRDILGVGLLVLSLVAILSLVPVAALGERGVAMFPSGNAVGVMGAWTRSALIAACGGAAPLVPLILAFSGLYAGGWWTRSSPGSIAVFLLGILVLGSTGAHVLLSDPASGGWIGRTLGQPLEAGVGWLGGSVIVVGLMVLLSVLVLGWNPLRSVGRGLAAGAELLRRILAGSVNRLSSWWGARPKSATESDDTAVRIDDEPFEREMVEPDELPEAVGVLEARSGSLGSEVLPDPAPPWRPEHEALPTLDLLEAGDPAGRGDMEAELDRLGGILVEKLRTFNVQSEIGGRTTGPVVTQFEVVPAAGVKVNRIANLDADLALAMKAPSIRIVAPIPGKGAVGVEIPNPEAEIVPLRDILEAKEYQRARGHLPLGLGKDLTGQPYVADLAKMPHLLIAGATGSGKSVCVNTIVTSLVYRHSPRTLRLLMIDPKMVELSTYADLPHLRHPVVTDPSEAAGVLRWAVLEMERRYLLLSANGVRSIAEFNRRLEDGVPMRPVGGVRGEEDGEEPIYEDGILPYVVVVVDELADLIMQVQSEIERPLAQLAQKARAIGIHLIVATQRPSVNVITGLIKANFPTRIAFRVASKTDSRTILDQNGAESLLGNGDMLFLPPGQSEPVRIQGAFIATEETDRLIAWYRAQEAHRLEDEAETVAAGETDILEEVRSLEQVDTSDLVEEALEDRDEYFRAAAEVCIQQKQGSTSLLQRRLRIGYGRAARIVDQLHDAGVLGPPDGSKPREVLIGLDDLDRICGPGR